MLRLTGCGEMRQRLTLQKPAPTESWDSYGQPVPNWSTIGSFWGFLRPLSGREAIIAKQVKATASHMLTTRWLGSAVTINPTYRWLFGSRTFGIVEVRNLEERNRQYEMTLEEIQQTGGV